MAIDYVKLFDSFDVATLNDLTAGMRSIDSAGNNRRNTDWGSTNEALIRLTNSYPDRQGDDVAAINATLLANPEALTETVMNGDGVDVKNSFNVNEFIQFFGQFVTHDISGSTGGGTGTIQFSDADGNPVGLDLGRNLGDTETAGEDPDGAPGVRDQFNNESAYLDLGHVYDNRQANSDLLWDADTGRMIESANGLLPTRQDIVDAADAGEDPTPVMTSSSGDPVDMNGALVGDTRALQTEQLASHHTIWLKNHNYHVDQLVASGVADGWTGEQIFNAARALNEAEFQWIVYNEYLPNIIGAENVASYLGYDPDVNADIINEFTTLAFRFGHDQANNTFDLLEEDGRVTRGGAELSLQGSFIPLSGPGAGVMMSTTLGAQADWIRGQLGIAAQEIDGFVANGNRGGLFGIPGLNLSARDLLRQYDHGVSDYHAVRDALGPQAYETWSEFFRNSIIANDTTRQDQLKAIYGADEADVANLDAFLGIVLEKKVEGSLGHDSQLGETGTKLTAMQFENIRAGDRFYFESYMSEEEAAEIKKVSLAEIIERNSDIDHVYHEALIAADRLSVTDKTARQADGDQDLIIGSHRADNLSGRGGNDDIYGEDGKDRLLGNDGDDWIWGGNGDDALLGGNGNDVVFGDAGNDRIAGGRGDDTMTGDEGRDIFIYRSGHDVITDLHAAVGERVVFANLPARQPITIAQWNVFLARQDADVEDVDGDGALDDVVITFGATDSLSLLDFAHFFTA